MNRALATIDVDRDGLCIGRALLDIVDAAVGLAQRNGPAALETCARLWPNIGQTRNRARELLLVINQDCAGIGLGPSDKAVHLHRADRALAQRDLHRIVRNPAVEYLDT